MEKDYLSNIKSIGIIGGGTAGYLTALILHKKFPEKDITLIESSSIPIIGVGEATTSLVPYFLHKVLNYDMDEFHKMVQPTWKLGVRFNWTGEDKDYFNAPMGKADYFKAVQYTGDINNCSLNSHLMTKNKSLVFQNQKNEAYQYLAKDDNFAYHLDNKKFVSYLKHKFSKTKVKHLDRIIKKVNRVDEEIDSLVTDIGETLKFDLYLDCSGFRAILSNQQTNKFVDYTGSLFTNRAITGFRPLPGEINSYTNATAKDYGWLWQIPLKEEEHLGYVYSSDYTSESEIRDVLISTFPDIKLNDHVISFHPGRLTNIWVKNVFFIGNAYGFVEPLDATGIHVIFQEIMMLCTILNSKEKSYNLSKKINDKMAKKLDYVRWLIALRFKFNSRMESKFWKDCREKVDVSGLSDYLEYFRKNGPISLDTTSELQKEMQEYSPFTSNSYDFILLALNVPFDTKNHNFSEEQREEFIKTNAMKLAIAEKAISMKESLEIIDKTSGLIHC